MNQSIDYKQMWNELKQYFIETEKAKSQVGIRHVVEMFEAVEQPPRLISDDDKQRIIWPECAQCSEKEKCRIKCGRGFFLTRRERILRYLGALADKVNEGWKPKADGKEFTYEIGYSRSLGLEITFNVPLITYYCVYFLSQQAAERVLAEARPEWEELFGIRKEGEK
jgi:hypothetical protein